MKHLDFFTIEAAIKGKVKIIASKIGATLKGKNLLTALQK